METREKIQLARSISGKIFPAFSRFTFQKIYPFTTENIAGFIELFNLEGKSLFTIGSSGDQAINAALKGCRDITVLDVCPFTKEYYELKKSAILTLSREEFLDFFCYVGLKRNKEVFSKNGWEKVEEALKEESSYDFWKSFTKEELVSIRKSLFQRDEEERRIITQINPYLQSDENYLETRKRIEGVNISFLEGDISHLKPTKKYDVILLSNLFDFILKFQSKRIIESMINSLNEDGLIQLYYLYETSKKGLDSDYITDPSRVFLFFPEDIHFLYFDAVSHLEKNSNYEDAIVYYQKKKH